MPTKRHQISILIVKRLNRMKMDKKSTWKYMRDPDGMMWASYNKGSTNTFCLDGFIKRLPELVKNPACASDILKEYKLPGHPHEELIKDFLLDPGDYLEIIKV